MGERSFVAATVHRRACPAAVVRIRLGVRCRLELVAPTTWGSRRLGLFSSRISDPPGVVISLCGGGSV